jgi:sulfofructose kinase
MDRYQARLKLPADFLSCKISAVTLSMACDRIVAGVQKNDQGKMMDNVRPGYVDVVSVGYTAVDCYGFIPHIPDLNSKLEMTGFGIQGGGPAATGAVTMSRLGLKTAFTGKMGDDLLGELMLRELREENINVDSVRIEKGRDSQFAFIMIDSGSADRTILWTRGTLSPLEPSEIDEEMISSSKGLLIDSLEPKAALAAARVAKGSGVKVVIDAGTLREGVRDILPFCDYIVASELFASQVTPGGTVEDALDTMLQYGAEASAVTLGEKGCVAMTGDGILEVEGFKVRAVDTTGAGDVFHGAFLAGVLRGWDLYRVCVFANAVAAIKCTEPGGRAGVPGMKKVMDFLGERMPDLTFPSNPD